MKTSNFDVLKLSRDTLKNLHHPNLVLSGLWSHLYRYLANGHSVGGYGFGMVLVEVVEASIYTGLNHVGAFVIHKEDTVKIQDWPFGVWQKVWRFGLWKPFLWYYLYGFENYPYMRVCLAQKEIWVFMVLIGSRAGPILKPSSLKPITSGWKGWTSVLGLICTTKVGTEVWRKRIWFGKRGFSPSIEPEIASRWAFIKTSGRFSEVMVIWAEPSSDKIHIVLVLCRYTVIVLKGFIWYLIDFVHFKSFSWFCFELV